MTTHITVVEGIALTTGSSGECHGLIVVVIPAVALFTGTALIAVQLRRECRERALPGTQWRMCAVTASLWQWAEEPNNIDSGMHAAPRRCKGCMLQGKDKPQRNVLRSHSTRLQMEMRTLMNLAESSSSIASIALSVLSYKMTV